MDRYIKKSDVVKAILKERDKIPITKVERYGFGVPVPYQAGEAMRGGIRKALRCIEQAEMVDVVEVVRCKDCIMSGDADNTMIHGEVVTCKLYASRPIMRCGDYCSYGKRKHK